MRQSAADSLASGEMDQFEMVAQQLVEPLCDFEEVSEGVLNLLTWAERDKLEIAVESALDYLLVEVVQSSSLPRC